MAAFGVGVLGLQAANKNLEVIGNNVANSSTVGFKQSRAEFADIYSKGGLIPGRAQPGNGVKVADISQQFTQGGTTFTENSLDMMLDGNGFFVVKKPDTTENLYTRAGTFGMDKEGFVVTNEGYRVQGYTASSGTIGGSGDQDIQIPVGKSTPQATSEVKTVFNLDYGDAAPTTADFDKNDPTSYNYVYTSKIYDSLGYEHDLQQYFARDPANANTWNMFSLVDGFNPDGSDPTDPATPPTAEVVSFNDLGVLTSPAAPVTVAGWVPSYPSGAPAGAPTTPVDFTIDLTGTTQFTGKFTVDEISQNGYTSGDLSGLDVDGEGVIRALYSNGITDVIGQVAVATFRNEQGLNPIGGTNWRMSSESGVPVVNKPGSGAAATLQSRALEDSNVDLSQELVKMILAQRDYQANAKTIQTADTITQTIINLR